ncbi:MAG TPA: PIG-L family deacetylase [Terriglobales bacterium]|nr:PIG-L family deacetylase [Terriglobales bacterium]
MPDLAPLLGRTLVLVAHPDDETVGCGALLQRMREPIVVFATDGAPEDEFFWNKYGSRLRYARVREDEARRALATIGVSEVKFLGSQPLPSGEGICDQQLHEHLGDACVRLTTIIRRHRPEAILTLAYEGGHPDHDACGILGFSMGKHHGLPVWEFPLYHRNSRESLILQRFVIPDDSYEAVLEITPDELAQKTLMLQAYESQQPFLSEFDLNLERFRPQPMYDYAQPPHAGKLNYEVWQWNATGSQVCASFKKFLTAFSAAKK